MLARVLRGPAREKLCEGKAMAVSPKPNKIQKARNGSNEKRHPLRASIKIQLQLKSRVRKQSHRKRDPKQKAASGT